MMSLKREQAFGDTSTLTRMCKRCHEIKPMTEFPLNNRSYNGVSYVCCECSGVEVESRDAIVKIEKELVERYGKLPRGREELLKVKDDFTSSCEKCGEGRKYLIDFHHIIPSNKRRTIAHLTTGSASMLVNEIRKCVCLCSNCHREFHHIYGDDPMNPRESLDEYLTK